ncbi:hypothetical protein Q5P01_007542 [Channa striata]|uniref:CIROZ beta domain-containing protein n=1 Tax=Channa striata TaxID=64152 RepID=A0AA88NCA7_CHASR|nr:hypothetical protein Q5P01_007542 [Channa striata]
MRFVFLQVIRKLDWSLSLNGHIIAALEDASLIQMNVDMNGPGGHDSGLTVSNVLVNRTDNFMIFDTDHSYKPNPTDKESKQLLQPFHRVDVVLTFKETNHKMHWTMENTLPCTGECAADEHSKTKVVINYCMIF